METKIVYYSLVRRIDDLKYYFTRLIDKKVPLEAYEKLVQAADLLKEAKSLTFDFYNNETEKQ